jgi:hypothetical protein
MNVDMDKVVDMDMYDYWTVELGHEHEHEM